ncbi:MAG: hypothetical protein LUH18_07145 [Oscillospiraceae bacterium]|nr:hypothetical protein [Oscillospiraceae bacterium]
MERFEKTLTYFIVMIVFFYAMPIIIIAIASNIGEEQSAALGSVYNMIPALDLCCGLVVGFFYGRNKGSDWLVALEAGVAFIPCVYIFFNTTAWIYVILIALATMLGIAIGKVFGDRFGRR